MWYMISAANHPLPSSGNRIYHYLNTTNELVAASLPAVSTSYHIMNRIIKIFIAALLLLSSAGKSFAQPDTLATKRHKIAVFIPLYLDEAFDSTGKYAFDFKTFPKQSLPGIEFYQGVQLALDTLQKEGIPLDVYIFDSKSAKEPVTQILATPLFDSIQLIIGAVGNPEMKLIADVAAIKNIPFISATYPNDAGVTGNPFLVILNATLKTHVEGLYRYVQRNYPVAPVIVFTKKGVQEERIRTYITDYSKSNGGVPLKIKYINLDEGITRDSLASLLDTAVKTVCIAGTLDDFYGKGLATNLAALSATYPCVLFGMPNWENWKELEKKNFNQLEVIYPTSFYTDRKDKVSNKINEYYKPIQSRPTDQVFKGYETIYHFSKLLHQYDIEFVTHKSDKQFIIFTPFDLQPVFVKKTGVPDYFENKKIFFVRRYKGETSLIQ